MKRLDRLFRLAMADLLHDRLMTLCQVVLVVAVLAPLLILFALKNGVATTLIAELARNPETLHVRLVGAHDLSPEFFDALRTRPETGFLVASTRPIATQIYLARLDDAGRPGTLADVQMLPTAAGDPLAEGGGPLSAGFTGIGLSEKAARELGVRVGDRLRGLVERAREGGPEPATVALTVSAVVPERLHGERTAFVDPSLLAAVERYRDDFAVPALGWTGQQEWRPLLRFANFRLYAKRLEDVAGLTAYLHDQGLEVRTNAGQIAAVLNLDRNLAKLFLLIGALASSGLVGALLASMISSVERKRRPMAVLALLGFPVSWVAIFPLLQALAVSSAGIMLSFLAYAAVSAIIDLQLVADLAPGQFATRLDARHFLLAALATLAVGVLAAGIAGRQIARIEPSEVLRDL